MSPRSLLLDLYIQILTKWRLVLRSRQVFSEGNIRKGLREVGGGRRDGLWEGLGGLIAGPRCSGCPGCCLASLHPDWAALWGWGTRCAPRTLHSQAPDRRGTAASGAPLWAELCVSAGTTHTNTHTVRLNAVGRLTEWPQISLWTDRCKIFKIKSIEYNFIQE